MDTNQIIDEFQYRTSRSGGKGGQHVNKVETKVEAYLHIDSARGLTDNDKFLIRRNLAAQISAEGMISAVDQSSRSQVKNKAIATQKLVKKLKKGLFVPKIRKKKPVPAAVKAKRLENKKRRSEVKEGRRKLF